MTTKPFVHYTFEPIRVNGDRRIVAAKAEWLKVTGFDIAAAAKILPYRPRVEIVGDLFEPWEGPLVDCDGKRLSVYLPNGGIRKTEIYAESPGPYCRWLTFAHVRSRVFRMIDDCPRIDFLLNTTRLKSVVEMLPTEDDGRGGKLAAAIFGGDDFPSEKGKLIRKRPNLILGTTVHTQREVDEWLPLLLRLPAAKWWVRCVPGERLDLLRWFGPQNEGQWMNVVECGHRSQDYGINWLTIAGSLDQPTNLDHVRGIIAQCRAAGVPVWVERLGVLSKCFRCEALSGTDDENICPNCGNYNTLIEIDDVPAEWPEDIRVKEIPK